MKFKIFICLYLLLPVFVFAQEKNEKIQNVISGRVIDSQTDIPLAYATVGIGKLGLGVTTNVNGIWRLKLPDSYNKSNLISFRYLGYISKSMKLSELKDSSTIRLDVQNFKLGQVVIMPDSSLFKFLKRSYNKIAENYPIKPTRSQGFYRETQRLNDSMYLYVDEAILDVYKNTYKNNHNFGQIGVVKSRKNVFPGIDTINDVRFYGGPHFPIDLDLVFSRWSFLKPSHFDEWTYKLDGIFSDSISQTYIVSFKNKQYPNSNFSGKMYIDKETGRYLKFELKRLGNGAFASVPNSGLSYIPGYTTISIGYKFDAEVPLSKGSLAYVTYKTNGRNIISGMRIYKTIDFVTTSVKRDGVLPIPYSKRFMYKDILSIKAEDYKKGYWDDYNVLESSNRQNVFLSRVMTDTISKNFLKVEYNQEHSNDDKILNFLKKFRTEFALSYMSYDVEKGNHSFDYENVSFNKKIDPVSLNLGISSATYYDLTKRFSLISEVNTILYGYDYIDFGLGGSFRILLNKWGRPIYLDLGGVFSAGISKSKIGSVSFVGDNIGGVSFDDNKCDIKSVYRSVNFVPSMDISMVLNKTYEFFVKCDYLFSIYNDDYLQFSEDKFIFSNKHNVDWDSKNLNYSINNSAVSENPFSLNPIRIKVGFRRNF